MLQYDIDNIGEYAELFKAIRKIILSYPQLREVKNAKQTSYADEYGMVVMIRGKNDKFVAAFGKGAVLQEKFPMLQSNGKIVRHLYYKTIEDLDEILLREILEESFILGMEAYEMKILKSGCKC
jgi:DNA-binding Lrp family transcriptional regulator